MSSPFLLSPNPALSKLNPKRACLWLTNEGEHCGTKMALFVPRKCLKLQASVTLARCLHRYIVENNHD